MSGYYVKILILGRKNGRENGRKFGWRKKKIAVLVCERCGEIDRQDTVESQGRCPTCGLDYTGLNSTGPDCTGLDHTGGDAQ